jgi:hypothetical protein
MEHRALGNLIVRMAGLFEIVVAMNATPGAIGVFYDPGYAQKIGVAMLWANALFAVGIPLLLGLVLTYLPTFVSTHVLRVEGIEPQNEADSSRLERVAVSVMGLWFVVDAVLLNFT